MGGTYGTGGTLEQANRAPLAGSFTELISLFPVERGHARLPVVDSICLRAVNQDKSAEGRD